MTLRPALKWNRKAAQRMKVYLYFRHQIAVLPDVPVPDHVNGATVITKSRRNQTIGMLWWFIV
jgi:hypothetical protein